MSGATVTEERIADALRERLDEVRGEIRAACERSGRDPSDVTLVAVTKYTPWPVVQQFVRLHAVCGESRPQQLAERAVLLPDVEWHLIGQLQRNKVSLALAHAALIHSVDSLRLLERIQSVAENREIPSVRVLLQINLSREEAKSGFDADEIRRDWPAICAGCFRVRIDGLMTMAAAADDPEAARPVFRELRELRDELQQVTPPDAGHRTLSQLSMGMSGDFVPAIEEGSTLVRVGSRLFEGIDADDSPDDA